jgi:CubicO group peptidase (beta-lactamase class C family)
VSPPEGSLRRADPASVGLDAGVLDGPLARLLAENHTRAAALVVRGRLVWELYRDGCDAATRFDTFSIAKSFMAAAIALLEADGLLSLDDPACRFLPEWAGDARRAITIRHLLTMTSGLALHYGRFTAAPDATAAALAWPLLRRPGARWCYEQAAAHALTPIVVRASGRQPLELLRERVLDPIGAGDVGWMRAGNGDCLGWRSVLASARDVARFGELLLARGRWGGQALLGERFVGRMIGGDPLTAAAAADPPREEPHRRAYGFLCWHNRGGIWPGVHADGFALLGAWGNSCLVDPRHDFVFVRLVTPEGRRPSPARDGNALALLDHGNARLWRAVLAAFDPETRPLAAARRALRARAEDARGRLAAWSRDRGLLLGVLP